MFLSRGITRAFSIVSETYPFCSDMLTILVITGTQISRLNLSSQVGIEYKENDLGGDTILLICTSIISVQECRVFS